MVPEGFVSSKRKAKPAPKRAKAKKADAAPLTPETKFDPDTGGQPKHEPTAQLREQVEQMAAFGNDAEMIASILRMDPRTVKKYYADELARGPLIASSKVAAALYKRAVKDGVVDAQKFWLKAQAGWREQMELVGKNGGAIMINVSKDDLAL